MTIRKVWAVYFSATGTTKKIVETVAVGISRKTGAGYGIFDFTLPGARTAALSFEAQDLVVFGTPVYAGRVPNVLLKYLDTVKGNGAAAIPVVLYGNRDYDDALIELSDLLENEGFHTIAAGAFVGEHSFSYDLAKGRPDETDLTQAGDFAEAVADKINSMDEKADFLPIAVKGTPSPYRGYYQPRDRQGNPVDIRKVKPVTNERCTGCGICAEICPMGSINPDNTRELTGICIKCGACIKRCPVQAKSFDDAGFLYHKRELEEGLTRRAAPELFL